MIKNKLWLLLVMIFLMLVSCKSTGIYSTEKTCKLIDAMIREENISNILSIDNSKHQNIPIRVTDLTGKLRKCIANTIVIRKGLYVNYFVVSILSPTLNTGRFRDLVITRVKAKNDKIFLATFISYFETSDNKNENLLVNQTFRYSEDESMFVLDTVKVYDWDEPMPSIDYPKEKKNKSK